MEAEGNQKKLYDVGVEKLRLIDINNEDDDFLIDFPLLHSVDDFRLSVTYTDNNEHVESKLLAPSMSLNAKNKAKVHLKNEHHLSASDSIEPARPSYMRKSLAWDDAFFTSAGVLDPFELTFINKGLNADIDAQKHEAKSTINGKAAKMTELSAQNKMKIKRNSNNKTVIPRSEKRDIKHISRREEFDVMSIKPSRSCDRLKSEDQSKSASWITYDLKKNNKAATNESAKHAMLCKKPFSGSTSCDFSSGYLSCPKISSPKVRSASSASHDTPASVYPFAATKTDRRSKLYASASFSRIPLSQLKKDFSGPKYPDLSMSNASSSGPTSNYKHQKTEMENFTYTSAESGWIALADDVIQGSNLLNTSRRKSSLSMQSVEMNSPALMKTKDIIDSSSSTTESRKRLKPSGLRQPLPKLGFFDEGKSTSATARVGLQFQFQKECSPPSIRVTPRSLKHAKSTPVKASSNLKSQSNAASHRRHNCGEVEDICSNSRKTSQLKKQDDQTTVKGKKTRIGSEKKEQNDNNHVHTELTHPSKEKEISHQQSAAVNQHFLDDKKPKSSAEMEMQVNDLSRYFEIIDLSNESNVDSKSPCFDGKSMVLDQQKHPPMSPKASQLHLSFDNLPHSRTPLVDKTSLCNRVESSLAFSGKSTNVMLISKASAVSPFQVTAKENSPGPQAFDT